MRRGSVASSVPSVTSRSVPPRPGAAAGPALRAAIPLRFPAAGGCLPGLRVSPGGRARTPMEEPLALHPVKLYVYDLSKGMARRLSPLMLGKSTAGAPAPPRTPLPSRRLPGAPVPIPAAAALTRRATGPGVASPAPRPVSLSRGSVRREELPRGAGTRAERRLGVCEPRGV